MKAFGGRGTGALLLREVLLFVDDSEFGERLIEVDSKTSDIASIGFVEEAPCVSWMSGC